MPITIRGISPCRRRELRSHHYQQHLVRDLVLVVRRSRGAALTQGGDVVTWDHVAAPGTLAGVDVADVLSQAAPGSCPPNRSRASSLASPQHPWGVARPEGQAKPLVLLSCPVFAGQRPRGPRCVAGAWQEQSPPCRTRPRESCPRRLARGVRRCSASWWRMRAAVKEACKPSATRRISDPQKPVEDRHNRNV
jgi:hypothetical protein